MLSGEGGATGGAAGGGGLGAAVMSEREKFVSTFIEAAIQQSWFETLPIEFIKDFKRNDELMEALKNPPICAITQEPPVDPVLADDGNTYDRAALLQWLEVKTVSPATGLPMRRGLIDMSELKLALEATQPADIPEFFFCAPEPAAGKITFVLLPLCAACPFVLCAPLRCLSVLFSVIGV